MVTWKWFAWIHMNRENIDGANQALVASGGGQMTPISSIQALQNSSSAPSPPKLHIVPPPLVGLIVYLALELLSFENLVLSSSLSIWPCLKLLQIRLCFMSNVVYTLQKNI